MGDNDSYSKIFELKNGMNNKKTNFNDYSNYSIFINFFLLLNFFESRRTFGF